MSLTMHPLSYQISGKDALISLCTGLTAAPFAARHFELAGSTTGAARFMHITVGLLESLPLAGVLVGLIERIIAWAFSFFQEKEDFFAKMPKEMVAHIATFLEFEEKIPFAYVSKQFLTAVQPELESKAAVYEAMDLMFEDRSIIQHWGQPFPQDQLDERFERLKQRLQKILKEDIDELLGYREGMMTRAANLLQQAIMHISSPERCLEIVKILLEKGANPKAEGSYYVATTALELAEERNFPELTELLQGVN